MVKVISVAICVFILSLFFGVTAINASKVFTKTAPGTNWHPGFIEVSVEQVNPAATWTPPDKIDKGSLYALLVNTDHIIHLGEYTGKKSKTIRYSLLLSNGMELIVAHDYEELTKLIRASYVGTGKKA